MKTPYYQVRPGSHGRWLVCHQIPGLLHGLTIDADCPTQDAAERECAWREAERERDLIRAAQARELLGRIGAWR